VILGEEIRSAALSDCKLKEEEVHKLRKESEEAEPHRSEASKEERDRLHGQNTPVSTLWSILLRSASNVQDRVRRQQVEARGAQQWRKEGLQVPRSRETQASPSFSEQNSVHQSLMHYSELRLAQSWQGFYVETENTHPRERHQSDGDCAPVGGEYGLLILR
jgi:hypothetical protein